MQIRIIRYTPFFALLVIFAVCLPAAAQAPEEDRYIFNRTPLISKPYTELPLGAIEPRGWLRLQLQLMANGMTGNLDTLYPSVVGKRNGWLGGDGDGWERGPYWIDGALPLAHLLEDEKLLAKVRPWVEWTLDNQRSDGYIGPIPFETKPEPEPGLQKTPRRDWWPKMVMLKILQQHYMATGDQRVIDCLRKYFRFQLQELPKTPLGHWTFWGNRRGADNLWVVLWLYNITGDDFLLELGQMIHEQTYPYTDVFLAGEQIPRWRGSPGGREAFHCVNLAQGMKAPVVYYQMDREPRHLDAVNKAFEDIETHHGQPHGLYGGDEGMHGRALTQGSEFCTAIEMMYSLEKMLEITGKTAFADRLEKIAFNVVPTQTSDDFATRQYFQQANQVMCTKAPHNFYNHAEDGNVYGLLSGYPCCTTNLHQGWPKFTQHLWMASKDKGLAALVFGPSEVTAVVGKGQRVTIAEETDYPFEDTVRFRISTESSAGFPLHLRIPGWSEGASFSVNGEQLANDLPAGEIYRIWRNWRDGDKLELHLPAEFSTRRWHENSVSIERGPLVFALKIGETWTDKGDYREVRPTTPWNYALSERGLRDLGSYLKLERRNVSDAYPWNLENSPLTLTTEGVRHFAWQLYGDEAGPMPWSPQSGGRSVDPEKIELVPYGCTTLRISAFPTLSY